MDDQALGDGARGWQFERFVRDLLAQTPGVKLLDTAEGPGAPDMRCDLVAERDGRPLLLEIKVQTPQTNQRSREIVAQLKAAADRYRKTRPGIGKPSLVVAFPGVLLPPRLAFFSKEGVEVWDGRYLQSQARQFGVTVPAFVAVLEGEEQLEDREPAQELLRRLDCPASCRVGHTGR